MCNLLVSCLNQLWPEWLSAKKRRNISMYQEWRRGDVGGVAAKQKGGRGRLCCLENF
jgi:hypothetical protein